MKIRYCNSDRELARGPFGLAALSMALGQHVVACGAGAGVSDYETGKAILAASAATISTQKPATIQRSKGWRGRNRANSLSGVASFQELALSKPAASAS